MYAPCQSLGYGPMMQPNGQYPGYQMYPGQCGAPPMYSQFAGPNSMMGQGVVAMPAFQDAPTSVELHPPPQVPYGAPNSFQAGPVRSPSFTAAPPQQGQFVSGPSLVRAHSYT